MHASNDGSVTALLGSLRAGDPSAIDRLLPLVYDELKRIAGSELARHYDPPTLQATALVHDVYIKLAGSTPVDAGDRAHFLAIAARAMRQVLVDSARRRSAEKRGGGAIHTTLKAGSESFQLRSEDLIDLDEAIERLEPRQRQVVECRFFAGMEEAEIAAALDLSTRTVRREWVKARAWLLLALAPEGPT